jgi:DNA polymerase IV
MISRVACLDLDAFFVEAALQQKPELRGRPVAVGGTSGRGVICSASYEARVFGVRSGQATWLARQRCPQLVLLPVPPTVSELSARVREYLEQICPVVEPASIDEFYLDFTGCDRIYRHLIEIGDRVQHRLATDPGLPATIGIGTNRLIAKIASNLGKPRGILEVFPGCEERFLAPLPVAELPGVGPHLQQALQSMGVMFVGEIRLVPLEAWRAAFGRIGEYLHAAAQGLCDRPVIAPAHRALRRGISREQTLAEDTAARSVLLGLLSRLVEKAAHQVRHERVTCGGITVKLRYADFSTISRSRRLERTNGEGALYQNAVELFDRLHAKRQKVRLVVVRLDDIQQGAVTPDLFDILTPERQRQLPDLIDLIRARFGFNALVRARSLTRFAREVKTGPRLPGTRH